MADAVMPSAGRVGAIIVAAGKSERMGGTDKVFASLAGKPLLAHVVEVFESCPAVDQIVVVLSDANLQEGRKLAGEEGSSKIVEVCPGGDRRQDSVAEGLARLGDCDWVVIHDGARPCVSADLIERGLSEAWETGAAIAAVPAKDTVKRVGADMLIQETPDRRSLWMAQTPQIFRRDIITKAYGDRKQDVTDDAALVESLGSSVKVYMGAYDNIKVTTPGDLALAEHILARPNQEGSLGGLV
jgi:2-C-methyl-D-erythritol 4-phosphate cytidylyltransferase